MRDLSRVSRVPLLLIVGTTTEMEGRFDLSKARVSKTAHSSSTYLTIYVSAFFDAFEMAEEGA
jgi:hypothetical protein